MWINVIWWVVSHFLLKITLWIGYEHFFVFDFIETFKSIRTPRGSNGICRDFFHGLGRLCLPVISFNRLRKSSTSVGVLRRQPSVWLNETLFSRRYFILRMEDLRHQSAIGRGVSCKSSDLWISFHIISENIDIYISMWTFWTWPNRTQEDVSIKHFFFVWKRLYFEQLTNYTFNSIPPLYVYSFNRSSNV